MAYLAPMTGEIVTIRQKGNMHDGARCVYLGPWKSYEDMTFHYVKHLHDSPTKSERGLLWYIKGQETGWDIESLHLDSVIKRASFCAECDDWVETDNLDFLCERCRDEQ